MRRLSRFRKVDDMDCLVRGNNFLLNNLCDEAFTYDHHSETCKYSFEAINNKPSFPYLLVNIGTGTCIYRVWVIAAYFEENLAKISVFFKCMKWR